MAKKGVLDHPKTIALADALDLDQGLALGVLESLWHFTAGYARDGSVGRYSDRTIANGMKIQSIKPAALIGALVKTGWLDELPDDPENRLLVHDWPVHCEDWVRTRLIEEGLTFYGGQIPERGRGRPRKDIPDETGSTSKPEPPKTTPKNGLKPEINTSENTSDKSNKSGKNKPVKSGENPRARPSPPLPSLPKPLGTSLPSSAEIEGPSPGQDRNRDQTGPGPESVGALALDRRPESQALLDQVLAPDNPNFHIVTGGQMSIKEIAAERMRRRTHDGGGRP